MKKYLVTVEFRYSDVPKTYYDCSLKSKIVTIGVYDTFEEACKNGNNLLELLESKFELHVFPNGSKASRERFSKNGGSFGSKKNLVVSLAYLKTPFDFYAKIDTLKYDDIDEVIDEVVNSVEEYKIYRANSEED